MVPATIANITLCWGSFSSWTGTWLFLGWIDIGPAPKIKNTPGSHIYNATILSIGAIWKPFFGGMIFEVFRGFWTSDEIHGSSTHHCTSNCSSSSIHSDIHRFLCRDCVVAWPPDKLATKSFARFCKHYIIYRHIIDTYVTYCTYIVKQ